MGSGGRFTDMTKSNSAEGEPLSQLTDATTGEIDSWRDGTLSLIRRLIKQADPEAVEEPNWIKPSNPAGVPVWSHHGMICTGETYKDHVKVTFARGASSRILTTCSTPASKATSDGPSMFMRARKLTRRHSRPSSKRLSR